MPRLAPKPCNIPGCKEMASQSGYCQTHYKRQNKTNNKLYDSKRQSRSKRGYNSSHYRLRKMVMAEQPICAAEGCSEPGIEMDHIDGNPWNRDRSNLQMLCKRCHSEKTARETWHDNKKVNEGGRL